MKTTISELSPEARAAINSYLKSWVIKIGLANVAAGIAVFAYFYSALSSIGDRAEKSAIDTAKERIAESDFIQQTLKDSVSRAFAAAMDMSRLQGQTQSTLDQIEASVGKTSTNSMEVSNRMEQVQADVVELEKLLNQLRNNDEVATIQAINNFFKENPDAAKSIASLNQKIDALQSELGELKAYMEKTRKVDMADIQLRLDRTVLKLDDLQRKTLGANSN